MNSEEMYKIAYACGWNDGGDSIDITKFSRLIVASSLRALAGSGAVGGDCVEVLTDVAEVLESGNAELP